MSRYLSFDSRNFSAGSTFADPEGSYIRDANTLDTPWSHDLDLGHAIDCRLQ